MKLIDLCYVKWKVVMLEQTILLFWLGREATFLVTNDVIGSIVDRGILVHTVERGVDKEKLESKLDSPTSADTYSAINIRLLQTAFHLSMLEYVLTAVCFVTEIIWQRYGSKGRGLRNTSL